MKLACTSEVCLNYKHVISLSIEINANTCVSLSANGICANDVTLIDFHEKVKQLRVTVGLSWF